MVWKFFRSLDHEWYFEKVHVDEPIEIRIFDTIYNVLTFFVKGNYYLFCLQLQV